MNKDSILQRAESVTFEVVADEAILIDINTGTYFSLNEVGTEFWEMLDGVQTIAQHADAIAAKYEVESGMVVDDLLELANEMAKDDLIIIK
ncbi:MAG: PqqD family protein [Ardenticatenaceae bacterium]|nr:PqqD family protein [Anaerolineales bacterium]MCB8937492.1 PqqD family protein [Ardenticatenaceae bacterium]MCB8975527.1 PqqD family protein [Ardenticatenaceae bacterium]